MQRRAVIGVLGQLGSHLLHPVFPQHVDAGGNGLLADRRVVHLTGAHQRDVSAGAARFPGGRVDLPADARYIFLNRHSCKPPCLYITE